MMARNVKYRSGEMALVLAGAIGLGGVTLFSCGDSSGSTTATGSGGTGGSSATGSGGSGGTTTGSGGGAGSTTDAGGAGSAPDASDTSDGGGVSGACTNDPATATNTAAVVDAANALLDKLTAAQKTTVQLTATLANAQQWSNLPTTFVRRNGVALIDMSADAQTAAVALVAVAAGNKGTNFFGELRAADEYLVTNGGASATDYGAGRYFVAFIGTPSTSSKWMLQIAGHHLAYNFSYNARCTSATPLFDGVEPTSWTDTTMHAPLEEQRASTTALLASVSSKTESKLSGTFSDLLMGPPAGQGDTKYPASLPYPTGTTGRGVLVGTLTADQKMLVRAAIEAWVKNTVDPIATSLLAQYESDEALNQTYVGYAGNADLTTQGSYVRIDGPRAWIELTIQGGIVYKGKVHYHSIWRDKAADYGAEFK
jgi:hypothetical protein